VGGLGWGVLGGGKREVEVRGEGEGEGGVGKASI